jgi:uncharacterized membrane protein
MNRELFIDALKSNCDFLIKEGYTFSQIENNIYYTKSTGEEGFRIRFSWTDYGNKFHIYGLRAEKRFNAVEAPLQAVLGGELEEYYTIYTNPSASFIPKDIVYQEMENVIRFFITNETEVNLFGKFVNDFYLKKAILFYEKYLTVTSVYLDYSKLERDKISTLILNTGTDIFYRELALNHNSNLHGMKEFSNMVINELEPLKDNTTFGLILDNFKKIQSNLLEGKSPI